MRHFLRKTISLILILHLFVYQSCKKEAEPTFPVIDITQPYENQIFTSGDTVHIAGSVTHNITISSISVAIVDMNLVAVTGRFNLIPDGKYYTINTNIVIDNPELPTGNYYLHVKASDGTNETNNYTKIYIYEAPLTLEHIFLITKATSGSLNLYTMDTALQAVQMTSLNSDFGYAEVDGVNKLLYLSGKYSSKLYCYNYQTQTLEWQNMVQGYPPLPYFQDLKQYGKKIYASLRQKSIIAYNSNGALVYNVSTYTDRYPDKIHFHNNYLVSSQPNVSGQLSHIVVNYSESGAQYQILQTDLRILKFISKDNLNIFVFANDQNNNAEMRIYDLEQNGMWEPYNLGAGKIVTAEKVDNNTIFIAYEDKIIKYTYNPNGATTYISNINTVSIKFETVLQKLIVATKDKRVQIYNYPTPTLYNEISITDSIYDIVTAYNR